MKVEKLQPTLHATGLKNVAGLGKGTSDPFAIVTLLASGPGEKPRVLGKTEVIKNSLSPKWTTSFSFDYSFGKETHINVSVVDEVTRQSDKPMGSAVFEIGDILGSRGSTMAKKLKRGGTLYARITKAPTRSAGKLALRLHGIKLKNVDGLFGKSDPFFEVRRTYDGAGGGSWTPVYRGEHVKNNLNPKWEPASIDVNDLCDGDLNRRIQVAVYDHERNGKHNAMGAFDTTVNDMVKSAGATFVLKKGSKTYGTIAVDECKVSGVETSSVLKPPSAPVIVTATTSTAQPSVMPVAVPVPLTDFRNMNLGGEQPLLVPATSPKKPTFVYYVSENQPPSQQMHQQQDMMRLIQQGLKGNPNFLHYAAGAGEYDIIQAAILDGSFKKQLNRADENDWTPLHMATREGHSDVVTLLLDEGGLDMHTITNQGRGYSPLSLSIKYHGDRHPLTRMLRRRGGEEFWPDEDDESESSSRYESNEEKGNPNFFHYAAAAGEYDIIQAAIRDGSFKKRLNRLDENDWTPLHEAIRGGHQDVVTLLLDEGGLDMHAITNQGRGYSPLSLSIKYHGDRHPLTRMLRRRGGEEFWPDDDDESESSSRYERRRRRR